MLSLLVSYFVTPFLVFYSSYPFILLLHSRVSLLQNRSVATRYDKKKGAYHASIALPFLFADIPKEEDIADDVASPEAAGLFY